VILCLERGGRPTEDDLARNEVVAHIPRVTPNIYHAKLDPLRSEKMRGGLISAAADPAKLHRGVLLLGFLYWSRFVSPFLKAGVVQDCNY
jgi:hypothetical protein